MITETTNLILRPFTADDIDPFSRIVGDPEVMKMVGDSQPLSKERATKWIQKSSEAAKNGKPTTYGIHHKPSQQLIGWGGFVENALPPFPIEIVYGFAKDYWGKGFGREVAEALVFLAFNRFKLPYVLATVDPLNLGSIKILVGLGMQEKETRTDEFGLPEIVYWLRNRPDDLESVR